MDPHVSAEYHECIQNSRLCFYDGLDHGIEGPDQGNVLEEIGKFLKREP